MSKITNDYSSLFDSLYSSSANQSSSSSSILSEWSSIKNGSYGKLAKAYYAKNSDNASKADADTVKETVKNNNKAKSDATSLQKSLSGIEDADSLKKFVESYNAMLDSGSDSDNKGILRNTLSMTRLTQTHANTLAELGITIGEDNKLKLDEDIAKDAPKSAYKALFSGTGSFGDILDARASEIVNKANYENNKLSSYTVKGTYQNNDSVGNIYDGSY